MQTQRSRIREEKIRGIHIGLTSLIATSSLLTTSLPERKKDSINGKVSYFRLLEGLRDGEKQKIRKKNLSCGIKISFHLQRLSSVPSWWIGKT